MKKDIKNHSLLNRWKKKSFEDSSTTISKIPDNTDIPLSNGQQRLWFLQQLYPKNPFYNYSYSYTFKGHLDQDVLIKSIKHVFTLNEILRSTYQIKEGLVYQKIHEAEIHVSQFDLSGLEPSIKEEKKRELILSNTTNYFELSLFPLVRASLVKLEETEHLLIFCMHHIIIDKWSMDIFRNEMVTYYHALTTGELPYIKKELQYGDFAYWQSKQQIELYKLNYWKEKLRGVIPNLELPFDFQRKISSNFRGALNTQFLGLELSTKILNLSKNLETTPFVLLLSTFYLLLFRYTNQDDILIGTPVTNRNEKALEKIMGFFNETVVLRCQLRPSMPFSELVRLVRETTLNAFSNKDIPFELLVKELKPARSLSISPFFQVMFLYNSVSEIPVLNTDLKLEHAVLDSGTSKFDLTLYVYEEKGNLSTIFEYATDLFEETTIERFQEHFKLLLENIVRDKNESLDKIPMLTEEENSFFFSGQKDKKQFECYHGGIHDLIDLQGRNNPNTQAVVYKNQSITYLELDRKSEAIAKNLQKYSQGKNVFIGLCAERSIDMIIGIVGILKAGCAYVPLDPDYPQQRLDFILQDADVQILLANEGLIPDLGDKSNIVLAINGLYENVADEKVQLPNSDENNNAYLIYTSGSSGKPKGVAVTHKNILNSTLGRTAFYKENPASFLLISSFAFDSSKAGIFWTLCSGGKLIVSEKRLEQDINGIITTIRRNRVSHTLMLPNLYKLLLENSSDNDLSDLKTVIVAGEACGPLVCSTHFNTQPDILLYNEYGPTEATVWSIAHQITKENNTGNVPIGKPVANSQVYLLDSKLNPVPYGAIGEIYIGGPGVTNGYLNRDELTKEAFISNPFDTQEPGKIYKTGDLGKYRVDGSIEFLGRADKQIKIRGYRIELHEIENTLRQSGLVNDVFVNVETLSSMDDFEIADSPSRQDLLSLLTKNLNNNDIDELLNSVESLNPEERKYLLEQFD